MHSLLVVLLSGDVETNPGPTEAILVELKKLSVGQAQIISQVQDLKAQLQTTDRNIANLNERMAELEVHYKKIDTLQSDLETARADTAQTSHMVLEMNARMDDAENRSRRNNLIFYGVPDPVPHETSVQSEEKIIKLCSDHLHVTLEPTDIERAHRLGHHTNGRCRPLIVKLTFFKTKEVILSNGRKLKGTVFSIGEDFSRPVQNARKQLVTFAKNKAVPFSLRYKTLFIGKQRYMFDELSQTVKEIA